MLLFFTCRQLLGFRPGRTINLGDYGNPTRMVQDNINCYGQTTLDACMTSGWMETGCMLSESAKVRCDQPGKHAEKISIVSFHNSCIYFAFLAI